VIFDVVDGALFIESVRFLLIVLFLKVDGDVTPFKLLLGTEPEIPFFFSFVCFNVYI